MTNVIVLGGTGMLGSMVVAELSRDPALTVTATARDLAATAGWSRRLPSVTWLPLEVGPEGVGEEQWTALDGVSHVINAIGVVKPRIDESDPFSRAAAIRTNALFPHELAEQARSRGAQVIQIATDCVFSGAVGRYTERDAHDGTDVYGQTKSLGEVRAPHVRHLRCSIVGPEYGAGRSLLAWFLGQPEGAQLNGFTNHRWNGVTTLHFARICRGLLDGGVELPEVQHVVPADDVDKLKLLTFLARAFGRPDLRIEPFEPEQAIDRTLRTVDEETNRSLWHGAGYERLPTIAAMVEELAACHTPWAHGV